MIFEELDDEIADIVEDYKEVYQIGFPDDFWKRLQGLGIDGMCDTKDYYTRDKYARDICISTGYLKTFDDEKTEYKITISSREGNGGATWWSISVERE